MSVTRKDWKQEILGRLRDVGQDGARRTDWGRAAQSEPFRSALRQLLSEGKVVERRERSRVTLYTEEHAPDVRRDILRRLESAGTQGLRRSSFGRFANSKPFKDALDTLLADGTVVARPKSRPLLFARDYAPNLERAAQTLDNALAELPPRLWTKEPLRQRLPAHLRGFLDQALPCMVADGILFEFRRGVSRMYVHLGSLDRVRPDLSNADENAVATDQAQALRETYEQLRSQSDVSFVSISSLVNASGLSKAAVHEQLLLAARAGRASLSVGDWSLATPEMREAALGQGGVRYLSVSLK